MVEFSTVGEFEPEIEVRQGTRLLILFLDRWEPVEERL